MQWYYSVSGTVFGPVSQTQLIDMARHGTISSRTVIWKQGMKNWKPLLAVGEAEEWDLTPIKNP
jgi:hypothetical protein